MNHFSLLFAPRLHVVCRIKLLDVNLTSNLQMAPKNWGKVHFLRAFVLFARDRLREAALLVTKSPSGLPLPGREGWLSRECPVPWAICTHGRLSCRHASLVFSQGPWRVPLPVPGTNLGKPSKIVNHWTYLLKFFLQCSQIHNYLLENQEHKRSTWP